MSFDPRFYEGIETFNRRSFFEAHQMWESVWMHYRGPSRDFLKGLIQIALGLHHFTNGNTRGAANCTFPARSISTVFARGISASTSIDF